MDENNTGKNKDRKDRNESDDRTDEEKRTSGFGAGLEALALVSQLGLAITIPIVLGALAGHWIDEKLGTGMTFFLILLCLGIAGGFYGAYNQIVAVGKRKK